MTPERKSKRSHSRAGEDAKGLAHRGAPSNQRPSAESRPVKTRVYGRYQQAIDNAARDVIEEVMRETGGNVQAAAKALGMNRVGLWKRMRALGIAAATYRR